MTHLIHQFYISFQNHDAESMVDCYHDEIEFQDPAFGVLRGEKAKNMWRMLCANAQDLKIDYSIIESGSQLGKASWVADYTFHRTGRKVHNEVIADFTFKDGKIIKHHDSFDLHLWAKQAIGLQGLLLGWTSFFRKKLNQQTKRLLHKFELNNPVD